MSNKPTTAILIVAGWLLPFASAGPLAIAQQYAGPHHMNHLRSNYVPRPRYVAQHASHQEPLASPPSQFPAHPEVAGLRSLLPVVPPMPPRPNQGVAPGQRWPVDRAQRPLASFMDSAKGNDAVIEVLVGQGKIITLKEDLAQAGGAAVVAVGDPTVVDFDVLPSPRMLRLVARRIGVTDLSITTVDGRTFVLEVHVVYDLPLIHAQLLQIFPDVYLELGQIREHVVVRGQARTNAQVAQIIATLGHYLRAAQVPSEVKTKPGGRPGADPGEESEPVVPTSDPERPSASPSDDSPPEEGTPRAGEGEGRPTTSATIRNPEIINLIRVPGSQQVLLKVQIAELNRTALREIGADIVGVDSSTGNILGTNISSAAMAALGEVGLGGLVGVASGALGAESTAFGIFPSGDWQVILRALRANAILTVLAEPNLIALSGHKAHFLSGGEFPIPVPQVNAGGAQTTTVEFREFGVRLNFIPYILSEDSVRLAVTPEVSTVDFTLGTTLVVGGDPVPGLNTRRASTVVDLDQGQTLAIAGLIQVETSGETERVPLLGDIPFIGPFFTNTRHRRQEKELLVLVTPAIVRPMRHDQVGPLPGRDVLDPTDAEFYLKNRIQGHTGLPYRATTDYEWYRKRELRNAPHMHPEYAPHGPVGPPGSFAPPAPVDQYGSPVLPPPGSVPSQPLPLTSPGASEPQRLPPQGVYEELRPPAESPPAREAPVRQTSWTPPRRFR